MPCVAMAHSTKSKRPDDPGPKKKARATQSKTRQLDGTLKPLCSI